MEKATDGMAETGFKTASNADSVPKGAGEDRLQDANLPDNTSALRNLAQQDLHEQMIRLQYR